MRTGSQHRVLPVPEMTTVEKLAELRAEQRQLSQQNPADLLHLSGAEGVTTTCTVQARLQEIETAIHYHTRRT